MKLLVFCVIVSGVSIVSSGRKSIKFNCRLNNVRFTEPASCKPAASDFNDCLKNAFNENWPTLHNPKTNEQYPSLDPFFYDYGEVRFNRSKIYSGTFAIANMTLEEAKMMKFTKVEAVFNETSMKVTAIGQNDKLIASGRFKSNLKINEFQIKSNARFHLIMQDVKAKFVIIGDMIDDGQSFRVKKFQMIPTVKNMKFNITGLVGDDSQSEN